MSLDEYALYEREEPAVSAVERDIFDEISSEEPWALVKEFADLNRISGTEDERAAADYLAWRLDALGITYDRHDPELRTSIPRRASLSFGSKTEEFDDDFATTVGIKPELYSGSGTVSAEIAKVSLGDDRTMLEGVGNVEPDVEGKIALLEGFVSIDAKQDLQEAGAVGIIGINPNDPEPQWGRVPSTAWGHVPEPETRIHPDPIAVTVSRSVGDHLLEWLDETDTPEAEVSSEVETGWYESPIIVAEIEADGTNSDDFVLLHAHYDGWYPGVTDNATGDAGLLECARVFDRYRSTLNRDLRIAWWPGHTQSSYAGSAWYVDEFALDLVENCVAHVNMDSPGAKDATEFEDMVVWMPEADDVCRETIKDVAGKETDEFRPIRAGDYSFNNLGVSGMLLLSSNIPQEVREKREYNPAGSGGNSNAYHLSTDTLDKADPAVLVRDIRIYATIVARLTTSEVVPLEFRNTVERHREIVEDYDRAAGDHFDLTPVDEHLESVQERLERFYAQIEEGTIAPDTANEVLKSLSRRLVRINFASKGQFQQDPTTTIPPYPTLEPCTRLSELTGDDYRFRRTHLVRARNEVVYELRRVLNELEDTV